VSPQLHVPAEKLLQRLSYSQIELIVDQEDDLKRAFYEIERIRGNWSVRELRRQIASLYYERSGLSTNKQKLAESVKAAVEQAEPKLAVRDPYIFEFLGIKSKEVMSESDLEDSLLDKLQDFLLELGHGFCFEARQERILIGKTHGFVDLVFYHRVLKCHVRGRIEGGRVQARTSRSAQHLCKLVSEAHDDGW
jgi:predicted nuclease of restriction endonuclease-like (RecB) superfamily